MKRWLTHSPKTQWWTSNGQIILPLKESLSLGDYKHFLTDPPSWMRRDEWARLVLCLAYVHCYMRVCVCASVRVCNEMVVFLSFLFFPWLKRFMWSICRSHKRLPCTLLVAAVFFSRFHLRLRAFYTRINMLLLRFEVLLCKDAALVQTKRLKACILRNITDTPYYMHVCLIRIDEFLNSNRWFFCPSYLTKLIHSTVGALLFLLSSSSSVRCSLFAFVPFVMYEVWNGVRRFVCIWCEASDVICLQSGRLEREQRKTHK